MRRIFIIVLVSAAMLVCGCSKKQEKKAEKPQPQRSYLEAVVHSKDIAQQSTVGQNMKVIESSLKMHEAANGEYPDSLSDMDIAPEALKGADGKTKLVYVKPAANATQETVIVYDPAGMEGKHYVLTPAGVTTVTTQQLNSKIGK